MDNLNTSPHQLSKQLIKVGLTGGIGSGKSAVAHLLEKQGAVIIDTDAIAHQITAPGGAAIAAIESYFGSDFINPDKSLNRSKMRELVFNNDEAKLALKEAKRLDPTEEIDWTITFASIPIIFRQNQDLGHVRAEFSQLLKELSKKYDSNISKDAYKLIGKYEPFYLAYQNLNNIEYLSRYGNICTKIMQSWQKSNVISKLRPAPCWVITIMFLQDNKVARIIA